MLKILVVDDDTTMQNIIGRMLTAIGKGEVIGTAANGVEAIDQVEALSPDVVFLDVDMPVLNGIEAAKLILDVKPRCFIVFITAHETYMPEAFEMYAFDYILKPFKMERIKKTMVKIEERFNELSTIEKKELKTIENKILLKNNNGIAVLKPEEIIFISREDRTTIIYTEKENYKSQESLSSLIEKLDSETFIRSHKSYIVNLEKILAIEPYGRWTYILKFENIKEDALITKDMFDVVLGRFKFRIH